MAGTLASGYCIWRFNNGHFVVENHCTSGTCAGKIGKSTPDEFRQNLLDLGIEPPDAESITGATPAGAAIIVPCV